MKNQPVFFLRAPHTAAIVVGVEALRDAVLLELWGGKFDDPDLPEDVRETVLSATILDSDGWDDHPDPPMWRQDFEDGYISIYRVTDPLPACFQNGQRGEDRT